MESTLHHNAILTGYLDTYCLVCESFLKAENVFKHIDKPFHTKNLDAAPYMRNYKDESIRKVNKGYYCEFCNILFTTTTEVILHLAEATHIQNKGALVVKRIGNSVMAINDIYINEKVWNGLIENKCALCNSEFLHGGLHKHERSHLLNLVQKRVKFVDKKAVYRMVDNESFHCLTCNMIFALSAIETHFAQDNHKAIFQKCREGQYEPPIIVQQNNEKVLKNQGHEQQLVENAKPKNSSTEITKKSLIETPNSEQVEKKSDKINSNSKTNETKPKYERILNVLKTEVIPMYKFIIFESAVLDEGPIHYMVMNNELCVTMFSYWMVTDTNTTLRCEACEVNVTGNTDPHLVSELHIFALLFTPVVKYLDGEFVREVRPGVLHCGLCNVLIEVWDDLSIHQQFEEHIQNKLLLQKRLNNILKIRYIRFAIDNCTKKIVPPTTIR